jgi:hypothetical protein
MFVAHCMRSSEKSWKTFLRPARRNGETKKTPAQKNCVGDGASLSPRAVLFTAACSCLSPSALLRALAFFSALSLPSLPFPFSRAFPLIPSACLPCVREGASTLLLLPPASRHPSPPAPPPRRVLHVPQRWVEAHHAIGRCAYVGSHTCWPARRAPAGAPMGSVPAHHADGPLWPTRVEQRRGSVCLGPDATTIPIKHQHAVGIPHL